jgi:hypothetical protein
MSFAKSRSGEESNKDSEGLRRGSRPEVCLLLIARCFGPEDNPKTGKTADHVVPALSYTGGVPRHSFTQHLLY